MNGSVTIGGCSCLIKLGRLRSGRNALCASCLMNAVGGSCLINGSCFMNGEVSCLITTVGGAGGGVRLRKQCCRIPGANAG